jgi:uncharacterized membrane protein
MGHKHSFAYSINSKSQTVGCLTNNLNYGSPAEFLWENGVMYDLNKLIPLEAERENARENARLDTSRLKRHTG